MSPNKRVWSDKYISKKRHFFYIFPYISRRELRRLNDIKKISYKTVPNYCIIGLLCRNYFVFFFVRVQGHSKKRVS